MCLTAKYLHQIKVWDKVWDNLIADVLSWVDWGSIIAEESMTKQICTITQEYIL